MNGVIVRRRRRISAVLAVAAAVAACASARVHAQDAAGAGTTEAAARDLQTLAATLNDPSEGVTQAARDEAARRLVSRQSAGAREILERALQDYGNRATQLAVARALAGDPQPRGFVVPLNALIGRDRGLTEAAAKAMANYKGDPQVLELLLRQATNRALFEPSRVAVIRALGTLADKRAAEALVEMLSGGAESAAVTAAVTDALGEMTGLRQNGRDVQRWLVWWAGARGLPDAEFNARLLNDRAAKYDQVVQRLSQLSEEVGQILKDQYQAAPAGAAKEELLRRFLGNAQPEIRMAGAEIVTTEAREGRGVPAGARERLRQMIGDSAADVRMAVATALRETGDAAALDPILAQLEQEPDPDVRAELGRALATIQDLRAVGPLLKMLEDPTFRAAEAAAVALRALGPLMRAQDPGLAGTVSGRLRELLQTRAAAGVAGAGALREAAVEALVPLRDRESLRAFYGMLSVNGPNRETVGVRRAALKGLGELQIPDSADVIRGVLEGDPEPGVRLEAVSALGSIPTFEHAETLYRRMDANNEPDPSVREEAWRVMARLLPQASPEQLGLWAERFNEEPDRKRVVLQEQERQLAAANNVDSLATVRQQIGDQYARLDRQREAAEYYGLALAYWREHRNMPQAEQAIEALTAKRLTSLLAAADYAQAVSFASEVLAEDPKRNQPTVGAPIRDEVARLIRAGETANAMALIEQSKRIAPPLVPLYRDDINRFEEEARSQLSPRRSATTGPQSRTVRVQWGVPMI